MSRSGSRSRNDTIIAAVITGICTLAAGFIGGAYANTRINIFESPSPTVTITPTVTRPASNGATSGAQTSAGQVLRRKNGIQLAEGYQLSFADPALRPFLTSSGSGDLYVHTFSGYVGSSQPLSVIDGQAGFSQCKTYTAYVAPNGYANDNGQSLVGKTLCVTTGLRIAACYVTADSTQVQVPAPTLTMDCTVYTLK